MGRRRFFVPETLEVATVTMEPEQTPAVEEQPAPEPEEQTPESDAPVAEAPETETPEPEPEAPYVPDLSTDAGIAEAERRFPDFKNQRDKIRADARNAEKQRLTRELGEDTRVQHLVSQLRDRLLDADDANVPKTVAEALKLNSDYHADRLSKAAAMAAAKNFGWDDDTLSAVVGAIDTKVGADLDTYANTIFEASVKASAKKEAAAEIEKAEKRIQKDYDAKLAAAKKAMALEAQPQKDSPPTSSGGGAVTGITPATWAAATYEQRQEWKKQGVEPVLV